MATNTPISYCAKCDAKDAAIVELKEQLLTMEEFHSHAAFKVSERDVEIAALTEAKDLYTRVIAHANEYLAELQDQLTQAEAVLREIPCNCDGNHDEKNDRCGLAIARAYFVAKESKDAPE